MDSNFTFVLPMLYLRKLRRCVKFVVILPLGAVPDGYSSQPVGCLEHALPLP